MSNQDTNAAKNSKDKKLNQNVKFEDMNIDNEIISEPKNIDCIKKFFDQKKKPKNKTQLTKKLDKLQNSQKTNIQDSEENNNIDKKTTDSKYNKKPKGSYKFGDFLRVVDDFEIDNIETMEWNMIPCC